ncbi:MAG: protease inhibitor I42 family protein [Armatimonadetes bacterium]|nr:protease inhibitor I42 family protein [Armatimonadota bacterium]
MGGPSMGQSLTKEGVLLMKRTLITALILASALAIFVSQAFAAPKTHLVYVTDVDANAAVGLLPNAGVMVVALESKPATGLTWQVKSMNANVLEQVGKPFTRTFKNGKAVTTMMFKALNAGTDDLVLHLSKGQSKGPFEEFKLHVKVGGDVQPTTPIKPQG